MSMDLTLRLRVRADCGAADALREIVGQYTASFNRACAVGRGMPRLNGVELHHQTYEPNGPLPTSPHNWSSAPA